MTPRERLVVALDVPTAEAARQLVSQLSGKVGMFKVGMQLFTAAGPGFVSELALAGHPVFLDLKYHDIPNTVGQAVASAVQLGVSLVNVHALGGKAMLEAAVEARAGSRSRLLAVTILTSHDQQTLSQIGLSLPLKDAVRRLALLARDSGADGVVASPQEVTLIREACGESFLLVTPGVRPAGAALGDQARPATPRTALRDGADYLVVGRPITSAADPAAAADEIVAEMASA